MSYLKIFKEDFIMLADSYKNHDDKGYAKNKTLNITMKIDSTKICDYKKQENKSKGVTYKIYLHSADCFGNSFGKRLKGTAIVGYKADNKQNHPVLTVFAKSFFIEH